MNEILSILLWPALICLVLAGLHAYLGLHVVERGVIFVDLSLAQVASLGTTVAVLMGHDVHGMAAYWVSLGFTVLGAGVFAMTRSRRSKIPQEAIIGIVYAVSAAAAVLIMDRLPEGAEHIKYILVGNLLAVTPQDVAKIAVIYTAIGLFHWFCRRPFLAISTSHEDPSATGLNVRLWDFLFYVSFGLVVTYSVAIAGVLLVFSLLIVPSVAAMLFSDRIGVRLTIAWILGAAACLTGMYASYHMDSPTGATIVCTFGAFLLAMAAIRPLVARKA